nr:hypothetical protein CFP56_70657 [Quercus suber]
MISKILRSPSERYSGASMALLVAYLRCVRIEEMVVARRVEEEFTAGRTVREERENCETLRKLAKSGVMIAIASG